MFILQNARFGSAIQMKSVKQLFAVFSKRWSVAGRNGRKNSAHHLSHRVRPQRRQRFLSFRIASFRSLSLHLVTLPTDKPISLLRRVSAHTLEPESLPQGPL